MYEIVEGNRTKFLDTVRSSAHRKKPFSEEIPHFTPPFVLGDLTWKSISKESKKELVDNLKTLGKEGIFYPFESSSLCIELMKELEKAFNTYKNSTYIEPVIDTAILLFHTCPNDYDVTLVPKVIKELTEKIKSMHAECNNSNRKMSDKSINEYYRMLINLECALRANCTENLAPKAATALGEAWHQLSLARTGDNLKKIAESAAFSMRSIYLDKTNEDYTQQFEQQYKNLIQITCRDNSDDFGDDNNNSTSTEQAETEQENQDNNEQIKSIVDWPQRALKLAFLQCFGAMFDSSASDILPTVTNLTRAVELNGAKYKNLWAVVNEQNLEKLNAESEISCKMMYIHRFPDSLKTKFVDEIKKQSAFDIILMTYSCDFKTDLWIEGLNYWLISQINNDEDVANKLFEDEMFKNDTNSSKLQMAALLYALGPTVDSGILSVLLENISENLKETLTTNTYFTVSASLNVIHNEKYDKNIILVKEKQFLPMLNKLKEDSEKFEMLMHRVYDTDESQIVLARAGYPKLTKMVLDHMSPLSKDVVNELLAKGIPSSIYTMLHKLIGNHLNNFFNDEIENKAILKSDVNAVTESLIKTEAGRHEFLNNHELTFVVERFTALELYLSSKNDRFLPMFKLIWNEIERRCNPENENDLALCKAILMQDNYAMLLMVATHADISLAGGSFPDSPIGRFKCLSKLIHIFKTVFNTYNERKVIIEQLKDNPLVLTIVNALFYVEQSSDELKLLVGILGEAKQTQIKDNLFLRCEIKEQSCILDWFDKRALKSGILEAIARHCNQNAVSIINLFSEGANEKYLVAFGSHSHELKLAILNSNVSIPIIMNSFEDTGLFKDMLKTFKKLCLAHEANISGESVLKDLFKSNAIRSFSFKDIDKRIVAKSKNIYRLYFDNSIYLFEKIITSNTDRLQIADANKYMRMIFLILVDFKRADGCSFVTNLSEEEKNYVLDPIKELYPEPTIFSTLYLYNLVTKINQPSFNEEIVNMIKVKGVYQYTHLLSSDFSFHSKIKMYTHSLLLGISLTHNGNLNWLETLCRTDFLRNFENKYKLLKEFLQEENIFSWEDIRYSYMSKVCSKPILTLLTCQIKFERVYNKVNNTDSKKESTTSNGWFSGFWGSSSKYTEEQLKILQESQAEYIKTVNEYSDTTDIDDLRQQPFMTIEKSKIDNADTTEDLIEKAKSKSFGSVCG